MTEATIVPAPETPPPVPQPRRVSFGEAFRVWLKIALNSFGGPAGQIAVMHRVLVEEKRWVSESRFLHALNYCMLLPGPEAQQLITYIGWLMHRTWGGLVAGSLFVLPGFVALMVLSVLYAAYRDVTAVEALFFGLKPAVLAVVVEAVLRIGKRVIKNRVMLALAALAFVAIFVFEVPFPAIVLAAGITGLIGGRVRPETFQVIKPPSPKGAAANAAAVDVILDEEMPAHTRPCWRHATGTALIFLALWLGPVMLLHMALGPQHVLVQEGWFFSKAAVVTLGGAYAVLAYLAQEAVNTYGWLKPGEMLDGLGMAETTPGPLIQVVQFVAFMGAYRQAGALDPWLAGVLAAVLTTWVTYVPSMMWIFVGAPYIEALRGNRHLTSALSAITAAVVGVILNLAVWFAVHTLFGTVHEIHTHGLRLLVPAWATLNVASLVLAVGAMVAMFRYKVGMIPTLAASAALGMIYILLQRGA